MEQAIPQPGGLFASVGAAMFRRAVLLLGDERAAIQTVETLFVRFVVHAGGPALADRARWRWIYRVVTSHCLRLVSDDAGKASSAAAAGRPVLAVLAAGVDLGRWRAFDEATRNMAVLAAWDGLTSDEVAEVLELPTRLVRRRLVASLPDTLAVRGAAGESSVGGGVSSAAHPSRFALDADRPAHAEHVAGCDRCRTAIDEADGATGHFARDIAPELGPRMVAAVRDERARRASRPRWRRALWMTGALVAVSALALLVARPRRPDRVEAPYAGLKGASRQKASGLQISLRRAEVVEPLKPGAALRSGDRLHFRVRSERPRYLELRVRRVGAGAGAVTGHDVRIFPAVGGESVLVLPGQPLDRDYVLDVAAGPGQPLPAEKLWILALFADHPFPLDRPPGPDIEIVPVRADIE